MDVVRPYETRDREACLALFDGNCPRFFDASERSDYEAFLDGLDGPYQVIERDGRAVACGGHAVEPDGRTVSLCWGMVEAGLHGTGIGTALTRARLAAARATAGADTVRLETSQHTRGFYERFGFEVVTVRKDGFAPGIDACEMRLRINQGSVQPRARS
ncbi:GNAT family N-acetyltransferase [Brevundimonas sp.]|uniref:GNAT family N-acetyltransferase n=1 Tax=Brevundimonas sp. TaxID=1871086 RepID=UPI002D7084EF|nr:GNAT family N-acetyltransferase [Brevundimonas sp.]HYC74862.1 GNAT family N-acetyltransferase [Brevundimonas sp.]